jgi:radical SAM superfamily enzyme YgiQ (UPF0313 family)
MRHPSIYYKEPVFRPPSEAYSLLIQATEGCTFSCAFCVSNIGKQFLIRKIEDIKQDIANAKMIYGEQVDKIFFLDGNAFVMKPDMLIALAQYCYDTFPRLQRVGAYAHAKDILRKSDEDLEKIAKAGITIIYLGIETGDNELLQTIKKQITADEMADAAQKCHRAGITLSGTIILGLAGNDVQKSDHHAKTTAALINRMNPPTERTWYISALTLMIPPGTEIYHQMKAGQFKPNTNFESLRELKTILEHLNDNLHDCVFRTNHASNYLPLKGILAQDKVALIATIQHALDHPEILRPEFARGL